MFLNFAWDAIFDILLDYENIESWNYVLDKDEIQEYWQAAEKSFSIAHALAQQGAELIIKSKIASVSPYLLLNSFPTILPKACTEIDTDFADFRTIDAQDIIKVYNTVLFPSLPQDLTYTFNTFRKERNALFHTVDKRLAYNEKKIISYIIRICNLIKPKQWPLIRKKYLEDTPVLRITGTDYLMNQICTEMEWMIELVDRKLLLELFDFDKRQRRYICPHCYWYLNRDTDVPFPRTAQLSPNRSDSTNLYCFVCGNNTKVVRKQCKITGCKGNVINTGKYWDKKCLTCFGPS